VFGAFSSAKFCRKLLLSPLARVCDSGNVSVIFENNFCAENHDKASQHVSSVT
jgi:hypothetical protein